MEELIITKSLLKKDFLNQCENCVHYDDKKKLPFAFLNFKNEDLAEELDEILKEIGAYSKIIYPKGSHKHSKKVLVIQNLLAPVSEIKN